MGEIYTAEVGYVVDQARILLAGRPAVIQSAILADLLAMYLAGHIIRGDPPGTNALRDNLLDAHLALVRQLVPINAESIHDPA